ncbi:MAG: hypothetical protein JJU36_05800 [Phycisphaeraceae bacterium]|nr:hypothetical protein [Phycisphaeraceae bacterium]
MITTNNRLRPTSTEPVVQRVRVDPDLAFAWLDQHNTNNRKVSQKHVERLARDMAEGKWVLTHNGIAFGPDGTLLDGQHRLWAIIESGCTIEMFVYCNMDPKSMMAIDCGKTRSMADILNIAGENGEVSKNDLATLRAMLGGFSNPPILSPSEASEAMRRHHDAIEFTVANLPTVTSARGVNTAITRAVIARAFYSVDRAMLKDFCRKLTTGIVTCGDEGVVVLLRQHLQENRGGSYSQRVQRYGKVERVLAAWLKGENPSRIYPASVELFPLPEEVEA